MSRYTSPVLSTYCHYDDMLDCNHLLIAGASGSGKSVLEHALIHNLLGRAPVSEPTDPARCDKCARLILLDPKMVELSQYKDLPHTLRYASDTDEMLDALRYAQELMETRFAQIRKDGKRNGDHRFGHVYVIIDELGDLMTTCKKEAAPLIQRIAQLGRAARVHIIACTQCPTTAVIPTFIKVNFDGLVGLRTRSAQDSRNIIGESGCELLPNPRLTGHGECLFLRGADLHHYPVYMVDDAEIDRVIAHWMEQKAAQHPKRNNDSFLSILFPFLKGSRSA